MNKFELEKLVKNLTNNEVDAIRLLDYVDAYVAQKSEETLDKAFYNVAVLPYEGWFAHRSVKLKSALNAVNKVYRDHLGVDNKRYAKG